MPAPRVSDITKSSWMEVVREWHMVGLNPIISSRTTLLAISRAMIRDMMKNRMKCIKTCI